MAFELKKSIVMVGMMGAGKTAVGKALAAKLDAPFLDSDAEIESAAKMNISEIFNRDGEDFFRKRESEILERLLKSEQKSVLSTGGGAFLAEQNRALITREGVSVFLEVDLKILWNRVRHKDTRPLLRTPDPLATLGEIYEQRAPVYALANITVAAQASYTIDDMAEKVLAALSTRQDVIKRV